MKISIITATYNSEATFPEALHSVISQRNIDLEYIVIDGGSKDNTLSCLKENKENIDVWISEPDKGIYDALNKGIERASGDIIGFLHSDDLLASPKIVSKIVKVFYETRVDGVYGDLHYVDAQNPKKIIRNWVSCVFHPALIRKGWMPAHPTLFLRKEVYQKHGLFNLEYKIAADYDLMLRIFSDQHLKFQYLPEVITKMRVGGASNRSLKNIFQKSKEDYRALKINGISFPCFSLVYKNLSKFPQFF